MPNGEWNVHTDKGDVVAEYVINAGGLIHVGSEWLGKDAAFEGFALNEAEDLFGNGLFVLDSVGEIGTIEARDEGLEQ